MPSTASPPLVVLPAIACLAFVTPIATQSLPGTDRLELRQEAWDAMVAGIDRFLLREIGDSAGRREAHWRRDPTTRQRYEASVAQNREHLKRIIGAADPREPADGMQPGMQLVATTGAPALVGRAAAFDVFAVRWPVLRRITGEGLLLVPRGRSVIADVLAVPDADQTPEMLAGLADCEAHTQVARRLAESGCRVLIPTLIDRRDDWSSLAGRKTGQTHREFVYRPAFELGRHVIGYEVQKLLAAVDWFASEAPGPGRRIGVYGYGEGGLLALYAAAIDPRLDVCCTSGYFDSRQELWREPIYRNVFGLLREFGDAEIASLIAPRGLIVEACAVPRIRNAPPVREGRPPGTAAPGELVTPDPRRVEREFERARGLAGGLELADRWRFVPGPVSGAIGRHGSEAALDAFLAGLAPGASLAAAGDPPAPAATPAGAAARQQRQLLELLEDTQWLLRESASTRQRFFARADRSSVEKWRESMRQYRDYFDEKVIGRFDLPLADPNPRTRAIYETAAFVGHEVLLDVFPDVIAYGILLVPKDLRDGERRPVVVCQHGLEGTPQMVADPRVDHPAYHRFAAKLAERGFITYSPQNPYKGHDRFRTLQRKANSLGKTLFSVIVPQHRQTTRWLASLPFVDPQRIAFYGLSYGGKTAMRVPALVDAYCLSICSADFNDWIWKNASLRSRYSYVGTVEYEIFEFDLGNTFNYAEMAGLIAPRPFMVERGHRDGVAPDERVAYEYAKVRRLYADLGIPDRTEIEFFDGPHTIHGAGTFEFLHRQLGWRRR